MIKNLFEQLKPQYKNMFDNFSNEYPNYTNTLIEYLKSHYEMTDVSYFTASMICSITKVKLTEFLTLFEDENETS
jgi:hypothetical protein